MAFPQGVDFRGTSNFVTDPTNYAQELTNGTGFAADYPTTTPQGNTVGWETQHSGTDRNASIGDVRLAGINYVSLGGDPSPGTFRIDLPATGSYAIQAAFGDATVSQNTFTVQLEDTTTVFATPINNTATTAGQFTAANGTVETSAANWAINNPNGGGGADEITHTFSTTIFRVKLTVNLGAPVMASLFIRSAGGGFAPKARRTLSARVGSRMAA